MALIAAFVALMLWHASAGAAESKNLALNKPASCSSIENDDHGAAQANDGDSESCWRADDEPESGPEWWLVDLEKPLALSGCQIRWPFPDKKYQYKIEGSADKKTWVVLSDQTRSTAKTQIHDLAFGHAKDIRYVKITITAVDEGCWPSISEVKVFGTEQTTGAAQ